MKDEVYAFCQEFVNDKLTMIQDQIGRIRESLDSESKNTAGDKHETGRAMLQLEREKLGKQLHEAEKMKRALQKVILKKSGETIAIGSLVETENAYYFIAISAGKFSTHQTAVYCISSLTPLAQLFLGKKEGDCVRFNEQEHRIVKIL